VTCQAFLDVQERGVQSRAGFRPLCVRETLTKCFLSSRLETRTKESIISASARRKSSPSA
jgi:hypothetical protein